MDIEKEVKIVKNFKKSPYLYGMIAGFGAISLSVIFFFLLYRIQGITDVVGKVMGILSPFVYGGVIAYLLRPVCNYYEKYLVKWLPNKLRKLGETLAVVFSMITGLLVVYALIIMIAPELYRSIRAIWISLPDRAEQISGWVSRTLGGNENLTSYFHTTYHQSQAISQLVYIISVAYSYIHNCSLYYRAKIVNFAIFVC
jgi:predicted PurR-regulated permease PerM